MLPCISRRRHTAQVMASSRWPCPVEGVVIASYNFDDGARETVVEEAKTYGDPGAPEAGTRRWAEWVLGREAVRVAADSVGLHIDQVETSPEGAPVLPGSPWGISIAHTRGVVLGAIGPGSIGIDVERADRDVSRLRRALLPGEEELTVSLSAVSIFVAKEAAAKATGQGLGGSLARWPVVDVELSGPAPRVGVAIASPGVIDVRVWEHSGFVTGVACLPSA